MTAHSECDELNASLGATTLGQAAAWQTWVRETGGIGCACTGCSVRSCRVCRCHHWWAQYRALLDAGAVVAGLVNDLASERTGHDRTQ